MTGGRQSSLAMSVFLIFRASSIYRMTAYQIPQQRSRICKGIVLLFLSVCVSPTHRLPLHPLRRQRAGGDGWSAAECLKSCINNLAIFVHLDLQTTYTFTPSSATWGDRIWQQWPGCGDSLRWPPYLKFHYIAAGWCTHQSSPHILGVFVERAHVSRVFIVVDHLGSQTKN